MSNLRTTNLPQWMPAWLWRFVHTAYCTSIASGLTAYFFLSIVNDITGTIPLWIRLAIQFFTTVLVFIMLEWRRRSGDD
jgi:hypothetical protein